MDSLYLLNVNSDVIFFPRIRSKISTHTLYNVCTILLWSSTYLYICICIGLTLTYQVTSEQNINWHVLYALCLFQLQKTVCALRPLKSNPVQQCQQQAIALRMQLRMHSTHYSTLFCSTLLLYIHTFLILFRVKKERNINRFYFSIFSLICMTYNWCHWRLFTACMYLHKCHKNQHKIHSARMIRRIKVLLFLLFANHK